MKEIIDNLKLAIVSNNQEAIKNEIAKLNKNNIDEAIIYILKSHQLEVLEFLLNNKFISNEHLEDLYFASVIRADKELLEIILPKIENKKAFDSDGNTALHLAVLSLQRAIDEYKYTYDDNLRDSISRYKEIIEILIESAIPLNTKNREGESVLVYIFKSPLMDVIKYLFDEKGLDVNNLKNIAALHIAAIIGNLELVKYLIEEKKLDINAQDSNYIRVYYYVLVSDNLELFKYFVEERNLDINDQYILNNVMCEDSLEIFKYLINKRADLNDEVVIKKALNLAIEYHNLDIVKYAVEEQIVYMETKKEFLYVAAYCGNLKVIKYLIKEQGLDINVKNKYGQTALHRATKNNRVDLNYLETIKWLVKHGADINAIDENGETALYNILLGHTCYSGHEEFEALKYLVEHGADVNARDEEDGRTTLHIAAEKVHLEIAKYLIEQGADVNAKDENYRTALHYIFSDYFDNFKEDRLEEFVEYLLEKGLDLDAEDKDGKTALDLALDQNHLEFARFLIKKTKECKDKFKMETEILKEEIKALKSELVSVKYDLEEKRKGRKRENNSVEYMQYSSCNLGNITPSQTPNRDTEEEKVAKGQKIADVTGR